MSFLDHDRQSAASAPSDASQPTEDALVFAGWLLRPGRLLGLDGGTHRIGIAMSDVLRSIASPLTTLERTKFKADLARIQQTIADHQVCGLVIGLPTNMDGSFGPRAQSARAFARNLHSATKLPILLWDERLTTAAAERVLIDADASRRRRTEVVDKVAATIILQGALDRLNHAREEGR